MEQYVDILRERFGKDSLISLATVDENGMPWVRTVNALFMGDSFYTITYALSQKMRHIGTHPHAAICGEWFSGHVTCENLGHIKAEHNAAIADALRKAFASWYDNGHTNEDDPHTIILKMKLTDGILFSHGTRYDFTCNAG